MYVITIHQRYTRTDGRTDRQTCYNNNTALCVASRGKNHFRLKQIIVEKT